MSPEAWTIIACFASAIGGAWVGYRACDSYWHDRIENRPESIHLGPYPDEFEAMRRRKR